MRSELVIFGPEAEAMQVIFQVILLAALGMTSADAQRFALENPGNCGKICWKHLDTS